MLNRLGVSHTTFTPCLSRSSRSTAGVRAGSSTRTVVPPVSSGPQQSIAKPSHDDADTWGIVTPGPAGIQSHASKRRTVLRCADTTPLGSPVLPDVNKIVQGSSGPTRTGL